MRAIFIKQMIQKSKALLNECPNLWEEYIDYAKTLKGVSNEQVVSELFQYFYEKDQLRPELLLENLSPFSAQMLYNFEQFDLFKKMLFQYQDIEQKGLFLEEYEYSLPDWIYDKYAQSIRLNPSRIKSLEWEYQSKNIVLGTEIDHFMPFAYGGRILPQFNALSLPEVELCELPEIEADKAIDLAAIVALKCSESDWKSSERQLLTQRDALQKKKSKLEQHRSEKEMPMLLEPYYVHNGEKKPLSSASTPLLNGVVVGKKTTSDELLSALLIMKKKHIVSFPNTTHNLDVLQQTLQAIQEEQWFDIKEITVSQKVNKNVHSILAKWQSPLSSLNTTIETSCVFHSDRSTLKDSATNEEEILMALRNEIELSGEDLKSSATQVKPKRFTL